MTKYAVIYEPTSTQRMREAIEVHIESMREDGDHVPEPVHVADMLEVA